jgi:hypothetical protein
VPDDDFDHLGQQLRAGAAHLADDLSPRPAALVRARGDQRRRRKIAGSLAVALVLIAGGGGTAYALGQQAPRPPSPLAPAGTATPSATPTHTATPPASTISPGATISPGGTTSPGITATTRTLQLGPLTLRVPGTWRITARDAQGDYTVSTGSCPGPAFLAAQNGSPCPSFLLIRNAGPTPNDPGFSMQTYMPGTFFWTTSTGATGCPGKPLTPTSWLRTPTTIGPLSNGYAPVTAAKTADYTVWRFGCYNAPRAPPVFYFQQRDWYLPVSRILIVDEYATPGLAQILATATWAG